MKLGSFEVVSGMDADERLPEQEMWKKILFLLSNVPYWYVLWQLLKTSSMTNNASPRIGDQQQEPVNNNNNNNNNNDHCGLDVILYASLAFLVAISSTLMHASQLQSGSWCGCCCSADLAFSFHKRASLKKFKIFDITCAFAALGIGFYCHDISGVVLEMIIAVPLFISGALLKRTDAYNLYMIVHSLWHVITASMMLKVLKV